MSVTPRIRYTRHCRSRMVERGISENMILNALMSPSSKYYDLISGATVIFKGINGKHLMVAYVKEDDEVRVITTFLTSLAEDIMRRKVEAGVWVRVG